MSLPIGHTVLYFFVSDKEEKFTDVPETFAAWRKLYVSVETQFGRKEIVEQFKCQLLLQKSNADFISGDRTIFIDKVESLLTSPIKKVMRKSVVALFRKVFESISNAKSELDEDKDDVIMDVGQPDSLVDDDIQEVIAQPINQDTTTGNNGIMFDLIESRKVVI